MTKMTFEEARAELKKISGGKYRALEFEITDDNKGEGKITCGVFVDGYSWYYATSWREALDLISDKIEDPNKSEAPEGRY